MRHEGVCALTKETCVLQNSHLYPKFMFTMMKSLGGTKFRSTDMPNRVLQDGIKMQLLGEKAEQMFSKREKWFAETIFRPYCLSKEFSKTKIRYDETLYYFIISILWRQLYIAIGNNTLKEFPLNNLFIEAEKEWRDYLNRDILPPNFCKIYFAPLTPTSIDLPHIQYKDYYLLRGFDCAIIFDDNYSNCAFYCKCPCFAFWGVIKDVSASNINYGLRINPNGGKLDLRKFKVGDWYIISYIHKRILETNELCNNGQSIISENQQNQIIRNIQNSKSFKNGELAKLLLEP